MEIIRPKRYIHLPNGKMRELCPGVLIKGTKVIPADPEKIAKTNRKLAKNAKSNVRMMLKQKFGLKLMVVVDA